MRILITGGAGYIGSILTPTLLQNHQVTVLDNFYYNQHSLLECCYNKNLTIIDNDVRNENIIKDLVRNNDIIIPLAAVVGAEACDKDATAARTINYKAIKLILKYKSQSQWILYPNTNSGYGVGEDSIFCTEETPLKPISLYGKIKTMSEEIVMENENSITFRLATVFGASPRMRIDLMVNDFTYRAIFDKYIVLFEPHFKRNFVHVRDVANAFLYSINNFDKMKNQVYNLGLSNANLNKIELTEKIKEYVPDFNVFLSEFNKDTDKRNYIVSNEKIESTGFIFKNSLDDGIQELIKGYKIIKNNMFTNL